MQLDVGDMAAATLRLKKARGHLGKVIELLESGADCEQVLTQLAAVSKAISRAGFAIVSTGLQNCVAQDGGPDEAAVAQMEKLFLALA